jgi:ribosomal protein S18 acetylase RimI-like enzyme
MLAPLSPDQGQRLVAAMTEVDRLVRASSVEFAPVDFRSVDAEGCLQKYYAELAARFPSGFELHADDAPAADELAPPGGGMIIARLFGQPVGCGAIRTLEPGVGELKRMWISPDVRGLGVGRRLLAELERAAIARKLHTVRLDTNGSLAEALHLYRTSGYGEIPAYNHNPYAQHWFEKKLI